MNRTLGIIYAFVFGAIMGSFLNVCIARWPVGASIVRPRSRCPKCESPIAWYDNVPILSWLRLRGKCRHCGARIAAMYPLIELSTALIWLVSAVAFGPNFTALRVAVFTTVLLGVAVSDARHFLIPDGFTVFGIVWVFATAVGSLWLGKSAMFASPWDALIGACAGAGAIAVIGWIGELTFRREAMGFGDVTLMAFVGAAVGANRALLTIFLGALLAVLALPFLRLFRIYEGGAAETEPAAADAEQAAAGARHIPFGVFLAPAAVIALVYGDKLINWYLEWARTGSLP